MSAPVPSPRRRAMTERPLLPLWAAVLAAGVGGIALDGAFPDLGWWPLAFVGVTFALVSLIGRSVGGAFLVGVVYGAAFFAVDVIWTARYLGPLPWIALTAFEALLMGAGAVTIALAYRWFARLSRGPWLATTVLPLLVGGLWTLRELVLGSWPYGGFPWGRVGMSQADGPLAPVASWVGVSGLTFLIVVFCAAVIQLVRTGGGVRRAIPAAALAVGMVLLPAFPTTDAGSIRIGAVQGNGPSGYFDQRQRGAVLDAQVRATIPLIGQDLDLVVWPEGGIDSDPGSNANTAAILDVLAARLEAPLLVNAATARGDRIFNSSLLWTAGSGVVASYDKIHPVPFGEYVPDRWFFRPFAPDLIDLIAREYTPGTAPPWVDTAGTRLGLAICFDVIYDDVVRAGAQAGATAYVFQTNNADFRGTDENLQQLSIARMRAIETGRPVVNLSTVGTSQVFAADGSVIDALPADVPGAMATEVPLRSGMTPAVMLGAAIQLVLGIGSAAALVAIGIAARLAAGRQKTPTR